MSVRLDDWRCAACGHIREQLLAEDEGPGSCPSCGAPDPERVLGTGSGNPPVPIDSYVERQRGHLDHKIARSVARERARTTEAEARKARVLGSSRYDAAAKPKAASKGAGAVTSASLRHGGARR